MAKNVKQIKTLNQLFGASLKKQSVLVQLTNGKPYAPLPAAFVIGMDARSVYYMLMRGVYVYEKGTWKRPKKAPVKPIKPHSGIPF